MKAGGFRVNRGSARLRGGSEEGRAFRAVDALLQRRRLAADLPLRVVEKHLQKRREGVNP